MRSWTDGLRSRTKDTPMLLAAIILAGVISGCVEWNSDSPEATVQPTVEPSASESRPVEETRLYVVQRGDTLARIASRERVPLADLVQLNALADPNVIEVGDVLLLEPTAVPLPDPSKSIVAREPVDRSLGDRIQDWWGSLYRPDLHLSDRSLSQGAVAGLMLPAAVLAFIAAWLVWQIVKRAPLGIASLSTRVAGGLRPQFGGGGGGSIDTTATAGPRLEPSKRSRRLVTVFSAIGSSASRLRLRRPMRSVATATKSRPQIPKPRLRNPVTRGDLSNAVAGPLDGVRRLLSAARAALASAVGRLRRRTEEPRRAEAGELWIRGTELLRIGLIDEAARCFDRGHRLAREYGWDDEAERHLAALDDIAARRQGHW